MTVTPHLFIPGPTTIPDQVRMAMNLPMEDMRSPEFPKFTLPVFEDLKKVFKMKDGRVLVNHLQGICSDLKFEGFEWVLRGNEDICENQQSLRVLRSGQTCLLGKFDVVKGKPAPAPKT